MFDENHFTQNAVNSNRKEDTADLAQSEENPVFAADTELYRIMERKYDDLIEIPRKHHVHTLKSNEVLFEILSPDGRIKYISEVCERVIGCKTEERIGRIVFDFYEGIELKKLKELFDTVLITGDMEVNDVVVLKDEEGRKTYLEISMRNMLQKPAIRGILIKVLGYGTYKLVVYDNYDKIEAVLTAGPDDDSKNTDLLKLRICRDDEMLIGFNGIARDLTDKSMLVFDSSKAIDAANLDEYELEEVTDQIGANFRKVIEDFIYSFYFY